MVTELTVGRIISLIFACLISLIVVIWCICWGSAEYSVWSEGKAGEAELARAEANRKIKVFEAEALLESSKCLAEAEVVRAHGVAKANEIIGQSLRNNESYLRYLWIQGLQTENTQVIYVPTEANLPILESQRLVK